nr:MAG TPA: hypothetical protein [Caudoviricetes sp.]
MYSPQQPPLKKSWRSKNSERNGACQPPYPLKMKNCSVTIVS